MIISYIGFSEDLGTAYVYVFNESPCPVTLTSVSINGEDVSSTSDVKKRALEAKERTLILVKPGKPFEGGSFQKFTVRSNRDEGGARIRVVKPFFPVGMYGGDAAFSSKDGIQDLIAWGMDTIVADPKLCDVAQGNGFKVIATDPIRHEGGKFSVDVEKLERYRDHPALLAWYVVDEPDIWEVREDIPQGATERWTEEVRRVDTRNPTYIVLCRPPIFERFSYIPDVLGIDPYPVTCFPLEYVSYMTDRIREASKPKPLWVIPQAFRFARPNTEGWWPWPRYPTPEEERLMTYMGLAHGAKGVVSFVYNSWVDYARDPVQGLSHDSPATLLLREEITRLSVELHVVGPMLVRADVTDLASSNAGAVEASALICGEDTMILFAINHNYVSTDEGCVVNPVKRVRLRVRAPNWMELKEAFTVTHRGLERVSYTSDSWMPAHWESVWCQKTPEGLDVFYPEVATTKLTVLTGDEKLHSRLAERWYQWRR